MRIFPDFLIGIGKAVEQRRQDVDDVGLEKAADWTEEQIF